MKAWKHLVQYYETDRMGIVHHSNYIRWMEEARIDFMEQIGFSFRAMEDGGVVSPVRAVRCNYKKSTTFGDCIDIHVRVQGYNGVLLTLAYEMQNADKETVCTGESEHVFLDRNMRFLRMKRDCPEFHNALLALAAGERDCGE